MAQSNRSSKKPNAKGRDTIAKDRFVRLGSNLLKSTAYRSLCPNARSLLVEIVWLYKGNNNGSIWLSVRDAAARMGIADTTAASAAFDELVAAGFIALTKRFYFSVKTSDISRARCWRITWEFDDFNKKPATNEWQSFQPDPSSRSGKRSERGLRSMKKYLRAQSQGKLPVVDFATIDEVYRPPDQLAVVESNTINHENGVKPSSAGVADSATHIAITIGSSAKVSASSHWWGSGAINFMAAERLMLFCLQLAFLGAANTSLECAA